MGRFILPWNCENFPATLANARVFFFSFKESPNNRKIRCPEKKMGSREQKF